MEKKINQKRNLKKIRIGLIIFLILLIVGLVIIVISLTRQNDQSELTINSTKVVELYDKINDVYVCQNNLSFDPFKDNDKVKIEEIDQNLIPLLVFRQLELDGKFNYNENVVITNDEFENSAKKLFGYVPKYSFKEYDYQLLKFEADGKNYIGNLTSVQCQEKYPIKRSKLVDIEQINNYLTLIVDIYKINEKHDNIDEYIAKNSDKLRIDTYRYIFEKSGYNYYLKRIERGGKK